MVILSYTVSLYHIFCRNQKKVRRGRAAEGLLPRKPFFHSLKSFAFEIIIPCISQRP